MPHLKLIAANLLYSINLGYIARVMKNFGFKELVLVNIKPKIIQDSLKYCAHACDILQNARIEDNLTSSIQKVELVVGTTAIEAKSKDNLLRQCITPQKFAQLYYKRKNKIALILGRESTGLTNNELKLCDVLVNIPADPSYQTLNVSHATAIIFYELYIQRKLTLSQEDNIHRKDINHICTIFAELCKATKIPSHKTRLAEISLKNILVRGSPSRRETSILISPLRRAINSLENKKK